MPTRNHLDNYTVSWYGPGGHESHKKIGGLNVLSRHISGALRKAKVQTEPATHEIHVQFRHDDPAFDLFQRHPKTTWINWVRDYRELEALDFGADNATIGEFSIRIAQDFQDCIRARPDLIRNVPLYLLDQAIDEFRAANYSFTTGLSPYKDFDASPLQARFQLHGDCLSTKVTMIFYLDRKEIHRREVFAFGPGAFGTARYTSAFDLYDNEIKLFSMDVTREAPCIRYEDLPSEVSRHLPSNEQLHAEWGTPYPAAES